MVAAASSQQTKASSTTSMVYILILLFIRVRTHRGALPGGRPLLVLVPPLEALVYLETRQFHLHPSIRVGPLRYECADITIPSHINEYQRMLWGPMIIGIFELYPQTKTIVTLTPFLIWTDFLGSYFWVAYFLGFSHILAEKFFLRGCLVSRSLPTNQQKIATNQGMVGGRGGGVQNKGFGIFFA